MDDLAGLSHLVRALNYESRKNFRYIFFLEPRTNALHEPLVSGELLSPVFALPSGDLPEVGDGNGSPGSDFLAMALDPLQLVESSSCEVAFSAMRTGDHRYLLDHEQIAATPITPRYATLPGSLFAANLADHRIASLCRTSH